MTSVHTITPETTTGFVSYEYLTVKVDRRSELELTDTYRAFGWTREQVDSAGPGSPLVFVRFKRDRRIKNRTMIVDLQNTAQGALDAATRLAQTKTRSALGMALGSGLVGTALLAVSVFLLMAAATVLSWVLGILGLAFWALSPLLYRWLAGRRARAIEPQIARQRAIVDGAMESASRLRA